MCTALSYHLSSVCAESYSDILEGCGSSEARKDTSCITHCKNAEIFTVPNVIYPENGSNNSLQKAETNLVPITM